MATKLDRLLESINPARTIDKVSADVDRAVNSFAKRRATIDNWNEYEACLSDFCRHIEKEVLKYGSGVPENRDIYWTRCSNFLTKKYGPNGSKKAFELVTTGRDGGLYGILKSIAGMMAEEYSHKEVSARISQYLNALSTDEQLAAAEEYLRKQGSILPSEFKEGSAVLLKVHFRQILEEHPKTIQRMRRIGR